jgi:molybdate transport system ATP-binding protein
MSGNLLSFACSHRFASGLEFDCAFETDALVTALIGPSGAGKTTMLSMIAGTLRPLSGTIRFGDQTLLDTGAGICLPPERRQIGMVFQDQMLFPHLSVEDNLRYGQRRSRGEAQTVDYRRVVDVLELSTLAQRFPRNLSGGERQRVAIGRALLRSPRLLLLDEPLSAVDEQLKDRILNYLERIQAEWHLPTLYVSHALPEARRLAERFVIVDCGKVLGCWPISEAMRPELPAS